MSRPSCCPMTTGPRLRLRSHRPPMGRAVLGRRRSPGGRGRARQRRTEGHHRRERARGASRPPVPGRRRLAPAGGRRLQHPRPPRLGTRPAVDWEGRESAPKTVGTFTVGARSETPLRISGPSSTLPTSESGPGTPPGPVLNFISQNVPIISCCRPRHYSAPSVEKYPASFVSRTASRRPVSEPVCRKTVRINSHLILLHKAPY